jgi:CO dehydrogenase/acetyl-CoA synthase beta subunit
MKWLLIIWLSVIVVLAYLVGVLSVNRVVIDDIRYRERENTVLKRECDSLRVVADSLTAVIKTHKAVVDSLERSLNQNENQINENRSAYEKDVIRIDSLSDDDLYRFFTEFLEGQ